MKYPSWNSFETKYPENQQGAFESLCRMLFRKRFGIEESLPYYFNNAGNETTPIEVGADTVGFQAKYFSGTTFNHSQIVQVNHSIERAHAYYPKQNKIIVYSNLLFGNPKEENGMTVRQKAVEETAKANGMEVEWILDANILDIVSRDELIYNLFFNIDVDLIHMDECINNAKEFCLKSVKNTFIVRNEEKAIDRSDIYVQLEGLLLQEKNVILQGESGSGKSAIMKSYLDWYKGYPIIWLNANQFETNDVNSLFHLEKSFTLEHVRQYYKEIKKKIIVVDSAEKLIDIPNKMPLTLLVGSLAQDGWQFVFTVRKSGVERLLKLLNESLELKTEVLDVPLLTNDVLDSFLKSSSILKPQDDRLYDRIHNLFYLARYAEIADGTQLSLSGFRLKVWDLKMRGENQYGLSEQERRELCLLNIAGRVLQNDGYYVKPEGLDLDALSSLVQDDVLARDRQRGYCFTHDIYQEWSVDTLADAKWENSQNPMGFIGLFSKKLTSINAFRRWFGRAIESGSDSFISFVDLLFEGKLEEKWATVILAEILRSNTYAQTFYDKYEYLLEANDYHWAIEVLKILPVRCKDVLTYITYQGVQYPVMKPVGSGWDRTVDFIYVHNNQLMPMASRYVDAVLTDYSRIQGGDKASLRKAGLLTLKPHQDAAEVRKNGKHCFFQKAEKSCKLTAQYFSYIHEEIKEILCEVIANKWVRHTDPYYELSSFIVKAEDDTGLLLYVLHPKEIYALMDLFWCMQDVDKEDDGWGNTPTRLNPEEAWGLSDERLTLTYFPASGLQTCIGKIIIFHPKETLSFIAAFVDKCVSQYAKSKWQGDEVESLILALPDGSEVEKKGNSTIWNMYRGTTGLAVPHVLECIHMALESYLLQKAKNGDKELVKELVGYIIRNSQSLSLMAVVASVVTAYPDDFFEEAIIMTSNLQFLKYDLMRYTREASSGMIEFAFHRHPDMLFERKNANALKHRNQHLETLLFNIQVCYKDATDAESLQRLQQAYNNVDSLKEQLEAEPEEEKVLTKFIISRCDTRSMKTEDVEIKGVKGVVYTPQLDDEQQRMNTASMKNSQDMLKGSMLRMWAIYRAKGDLDKITNSEYENHPEKALSVCREIMKQLETRKGGLSLLPGDEFVPSSVCAVLISDYKDSLSKDDYDFCVNVVLSALENVNEMVGSGLSEYGICFRALGTIMDNEATYVQRCINILYIYSTITQEVAGHRPCDVVAETIAGQKLWVTHGDNLNLLISRFIKDRTIDNRAEELSYEDAESILCLLAEYPKDANLAHIADVSMERISHIWDLNDKRKNLYFGARHSASDVVSRIVFSAEDEVIPRLLTFFTRYLNTDVHDTFLMAFVLRAILTSHYDKFWIVWYALYETIVIKRDNHFHLEMISNYMLNPVQYTHWGDDWFRLEEKDMVFFERIANDIGDLPIVLMNIARTGKTLAKNYFCQVLKIFNDIVVQHPNMDLKDYSDDIIINMEAILRREIPNLADKIKTDKSLRQQLLNVTEFMVANRSSYANIIKSGLN